MSKSDTSFRRMYESMAREPVMTAEQEANLAKLLRQSKINLWISLLSDPGIAHEAIDFICKTAEQKIKIKQELDTSAFFGFEASASRLCKRPSIQANRSQFQRRREEVVKSLVSFDHCMEIAISLGLHLKNTGDVKNIKDIEASQRQYLEYRNRFIKRNIRLVMMISKRFLSYGIPQEDLIQEGVFGLQRAVGMFDPDRGYKFSTYATWWIRASITRYCRNQNRLVRLPVGVQESLERYFVSMKKLEARGEDFDTQKMSKMTGLSPRSIRRLQSLTLERYQSIEAKNANGTSLGDILSDSKETISDVDVFVDHGVVERIIHDLNPRLRYILLARNGLNGSDPKTLHEIANELGISRERVRQLEAIAIDRIRIGLDMKLDKNKIKRHMLRLLEQGECIDRTTGEINYTGLCEQTERDLDLDASVLDDPNHEIWDWAIEVGESWERKR